MPYMRPPGRAFFANFEPVPGTVADLVSAPFRRRALFDIPIGVMITQRDDTRRACICLDVEHLGDETADALSEAEDAADAIAAAIPSFTEPLQGEAQMWFDVTPLSGGVRAERRYVTPGALRPALVPALSVAVIRSGEVPPERARLLKSIVQIGRRFRDAPPQDRPHLALRLAWNEQGGSHDRMEITPADQATFERVVDGWYRVCGAALDGLRYATATVCLPCAMTSHERAKLASLVTDWKPNGA